MDCARAIRLYSNLPPKLWGECILASAYMKNQTLGSHPKQKTPYEMWHKRKPDISHMRELGCQAWVLKEMHNPKIYDCSTKCILIGYSPNSKAYWCYNQSTRCIHTSRNVTFIESQDNVEQPLGVDPTIPQDKEARDDEEDHEEQT